MGVLDLAGFTSELHQILNRDPGAVLSERWVNFGYQALASSVDFEKLDVSFPITTVATTRSYTFTPVDTPDFLGIRLVAESTGDRSLDWVPKDDFFGYEAYAAPPKRYTLDRNLIFLQPTPVGAETFNIIYKQNVAILTTGNQTVLAGAWDLAIVYLAAAHAFAALSEEKRAAYWQQQAGNYIQTRMTEDRFEDEGMSQYPKFPEVR